MHPRWRSDQSGAPLAPAIARGAGARAVRAQDFFSRAVAGSRTATGRGMGGASWAVVAFAPEDAAWCDWIYRNLNGYPLPASLVDRVTPHGFPRPDCLSIFPDRRDPAYEEQLAARPGRQHLSHRRLLARIRRTPRPWTNRFAPSRRPAAKSASSRSSWTARPTRNSANTRAPPQCDWLPAWLRWRLEENGFRAADRSEPRVVDARRGYRSLQQVRDGLLTALVDMDAAELERLGGLRAPGGTCSVARASPRRKASSHDDRAVATAAIGCRPAAGLEIHDRHGRDPDCGGVVFGARSFLEITADEPASTLEVGPRDRRARRPFDQGDAGRTKRRSPPETAAAALSTGTDARVAQNDPLGGGTRAAGDDAGAGRAVECAASRAGVRPWRPRRFCRGAPGLAENVAHVGVDVGHHCSRECAATPRRRARRPVRNPMRCCSMKSARSSGGATRRWRKSAPRMRSISTTPRSSAPRNTPARKGRQPERQRPGREAHAQARHVAVAELLHRGSPRHLPAGAQGRCCNSSRKAQWSRERAKSLDEIESRLLSLPRD